MNFPLRVILELLGVPQQDFALMLRLTQELFGGEDPDFARVGEDQQAMAVIMDVIELFESVNAERRLRPVDDLASVIANGHIDGRPLENSDTYGYYLIIATAGHDTTSSAIAGGMQVLIENPDQFAFLRSNPEAIDQGADEIVRWVSPVKHFMRSAQEDYTMASGHKIARGDWLLLSYPSANRDERVFADPFRFNVSRSDLDHHLGFGFGRHYCLGAHLARLEIRAFFKELLRRLDYIELAGDVENMAAILVSGPKRLPVRYQFHSAVS
jgi:cytochrome P450